MDAAEPYRLEVEGSPAECLRTLGQLADDWGAEWTEEGRGGRLSLPVLAGVRHGWVMGQVRVEARRGVTELTFEQQDEVYRVQKPKVLFLLIALAGALSIMVTPLFPVLAPLIPLSVLLMFGAWLFIVAGLRNSGKEEFFDSLAVEMTRNAGPSSG